MGNIKRLFEINKVLKKYKLRRYLFKKKIKDKEELAKKLRMTFEDLGPLFVKWGQFLSVCYNEIPEVFRKEFEKLQDQVPEFPFAKAKVIIEKEFGKKLEDLFEKIEEKPIAAASLAQVYRAKLHTGEIVVVKVQRPDAEESVERDISLLRFLAKRVDRKLKKNNIDIFEMINELEDFLKAELDYEQEAIHADMFKNQELPKYEKIPEVYFHTRRVLVEEYINGIKISDVHKLHEDGIDKGKVIENLSKSMFYHIFRDGLFHGDPHPANILVLKDARIAYIDFGVVGKLSQKVKRSYINQYRSVISNDPNKFLEEHLRLNNIEKEDLKNYKKIKQEINEIFDDHQNKKSANAYDCLAQSNKLLTKYKIPDKNNILVLIRGFMALNNLLRKYGFTDKRFDNLINLLASLDNMPFGTSFGPEIMEVNFEKKAKNASLMGDMQNFLSMGKINEMTTKLVSLEESINKKGEVDEEKVYGRGGFFMGALILISIGAIVFYYNRLVEIFNGQAYIPQIALGVLALVFILNIFMSRTVKGKKKK